MEVILLILFFVMILMAVMFAVIWNQTGRPYEKGREALRATGEANATYNLDHAIVDPDARMIGLRTAEKQIVTRTKEGSVVELTYGALRSVSLTPVMFSYSETSGEARTRRGSQIIGAGLGGAVAGPLGAVVGGLSGGQIQRSSTTTSSSTGDLELELFFRDDRLPRFVMYAGCPDGAEGRVMNPELGEAFKDMAARLANIIDAQQR